MSTHSHSHTQIHTEADLDRAITALIARDPRFAAVLEQWRAPTSADACAEGPGAAHLSKLLGSSRHCRGP